MKPNTFDAAAAFERTLAHDGGDIQFVLFYFNSISNFNAKKYDVIASYAKSLIFLFEMRLRVIYPRQTEFLQEIYLPCAYRFVVSCFLFLSENCIFESIEVKKQIGKRNNHGMNSNYYRTCAKTNESVELLMNVCGFPDYQNFMTNRAKVCKQSYFCFCKST